MQRKIQDTYRLTAFSLKIDGVDMSPTQIIDLNLYWDINSVLHSGDLLFNDTTNLVNKLPFNGKNELTVLFTDIKDEVFERTYIITSYKKDVVREEDTYITCSLVNKLSINMASLYSSRGFSSSSIPSIMRTMLSGLPENETILMKGSSLPVLNNFIINGNKPFSWFADYMKRNYNFYMYQNRDEIVLETLKEMNSGTPFEHKYIQVNDNKNYHYTLIDTKLQSISTHDIGMKLPAMDTVTLNLRDKGSVVTHSTNYQNSLSDFKLKDSIISPDSSSGARSRYIPYDYHVNNTESLFEKIGMGGQTIEASVPGAFSNKVGMIITANITRGSGYIELDETASGNYIITEITDRFSNDVFMQLLTLKRVN